MDAFTMQQNPQQVDPPDDPTAYQSVVERTTEGRLRRTDLSSTDRTVAVLAHLWWVLLATPVSLLAFGVPLVIWLVYRGKNHFLADHGQEATNMLVSVVVISLVLTLSVVGIVLLPVLWIYLIVGIVRASIAAGSGEYFRYPATIRLL